MSTSNFTQPALVRLAMLVVVCGAVGALAWASASDSAVPKSDKVI